MTQAPRACARSFMRLGMWSLPRVTRSAKPCRAAQRARKTYQTLMRTSATSIANASATRRTHYQVLGVQPTASSDDIRTAFRRLAKSLHPDHNKLPGAREKFQEVKEAYDILFDISTRADYDRELKVQAMATAAAVAQSASGGRRASTTNVRRNRHTGSAKSQAATRPASGDDFDVFSAASASHGGGSASRGSPNGSGSDGYRSIFCEPQRATSNKGNNSNKYRSVFDGPTATAPAASSPPLPLHMASAAQAAAARSRSGQTGASSSDSGYKSIFDRGTSPRSTSSGRNSSSSGGSNPCIFNGRSISPNLGARKQTVNDVAAPYGSRTAAGAATTTATSASPASNSKSSRIDFNAGNGTGAHEASTTAAASAISGAAPNLQAVSGAAAVPAAGTPIGKLSSTPWAPEVRAAANGSSDGDSRQTVMGPASSSCTPYTVSPSIPGVGNPSHGIGAAAATPAANTVCTTAAGVMASQNGLASEASRGAAAATTGITSTLASAASTRNSIGDVASRLAAMAAAAAAGAPRSGSGGSGRGDYVSILSGSGGGATTQNNTSVDSPANARSSSPGRMTNGGAVTDTTAPSNVAAAGTASFQVTVTPKVVVDTSGGRFPAVESASQPPFASSLPLPPPLSPLPQQPLPRQPQPQPHAASTIAQLSDDDALRHPNAQVTAAAADAVTSALVAEAEATARVTAAMAAAAEAKAAAAAAEAMAAEAAVAAARAKAAAMAAEARLSAVVEAAESALLAKPWPATTEASAAGPMSTTAAGDQPQANEGAAPSKRL